MAKKERNPLEDPPTASSSDEDEIQTSEPVEEEEASSSDENPSIADKKAVSGKSTVVSVAKQGSDSDSGSETETDSDSEATNPPKSGSGKTVSVAAVSAGKPNKENSTSSAALALPASKSGMKRPASEGTPSKDDTSTKRGKIVTSGEEESIKKPAFQRLWSEEDEISVLQGMIDYKGDTGKSPYEDTNGFYEFVKKSISFEVSKNQFMDKIRSLRKKFMGKEGKNGAEPSFAKAHDQKTYKLSKIIWGPEGIALESNIKSNGVSKKSQSKKKKKKLDTVKQELIFAASPNGKKVEDDDDDKLSIHGGGLTKSDWFENSFLVRSIAGFGLDEHFVKQKWSLVPVEEKKKIEEKLKQLQAKEFDFVLEKTDFVHEVTSLIVEASKNKPTSH